MKTKRKPKSAGHIFAIEIIEERKVEPVDARKALEMTESEFSKFINGQMRCTEELANKLELFTGIGANVWLSLQANLDKWEDENASDRN